MNCLSSDRPFSSGAPSFSAATAGVSFRPSTASPRKSVAGTRRLFFGTSPTRCAQNHPRCRRLPACAKHLRGTRGRSPIEDCLIRRPRFSFGGIEVFPASFHRAQIIVTTSRPVTAAAAAQAARSPRDQARRRPHARLSRRQTAAAAGDRSVLGSAGEKTHAPAPQPSR